MLHWEIFLRRIAFECTFISTNHLSKSWKVLHALKATSPPTPHQKATNIELKIPLKFPPCSFRVWVINWQVTLATKHKYEWLMNLALTRFLSQSWLSGTMVQRALQGALVFLIFLDFGTSLKCYVCNNFKNTFQVRNWKTLWRRSKRALKCL